ncbi:MAG TPA: cysteine hydrolase [Candidatus Sulfotelmatobacter sp.]|nr:cysteine hydrolase [Candidatus Sulfotelmatobacter sp.]
MLRRYTASRTGLLLVDPFNDFLSDGGKLWPRIRAGAASVDLLRHLRALVDTARGAGIVVLFVPHRRWREGDFDSWRHPTPWQLTIDREALFADGTWGGDWHPELVPQPGDVVIQEHWGQNGFFNTDLDLQLKQHGLDSIVVVGMAADVCVEATARYGAELGYHVTLVSDATVALDVKTAVGDSAWPFAHAVLTTAEIVAILSTT